MNILEIYVTNISDIGEKDQYGFCKVTADFDCYGRKELQVTKKLHISEIEKINECGYYLG